MVYAWSLSMTGLVERQTTMRLLKPRYWNRKYYFFTNMCIARHSVHIRCTSHCWQIDRVCAWTIPWPSMMINIIIDGHIYQSERKIYWSIVWIVVGVLPKRPSDCLSARSSDQVWAIICQEFSTITQTNGRNHTPVCTSLRVDCCIVWALDIRIVGCPLPNLRRSAFVAAPCAAWAKFSIFSTYVRM